MEANTQLQKDVVSPTPALKNESLARFVTYALLGTFVCATLAYTGLSEMFRNAAKENQASNQ